MEIPRARAVLVAEQERVHPAFRERSSPFALSGWLTWHITGQPENSERRNIMTKAELVEKIHAKAGLPTKAKAEEALDAVVASLREALAAGESVTFTGFGSFKVVERAARKGRNPRTGKEITIPASKVAKFTPGKGLKDAIK